MLQLGHCKNVKISDIERNGEGGGADPCIGHTLSSVTILSPFKLVFFNCLINQMFAGTIQLLLNVVKYQNFIILTGIDIALLLFLASSIINRSTIKSKKKPRKGGRNLLWNFQCSSLIYIHAGSFKFVSFGSEKYKLYWLRVLY